MTATIVLKRASRGVWLRHRAQGLGGTDVAAILGLNPYRTQLDVWLEKTGRDADLDLSDSYPMRRGSWMEKLLLAEYARTHPAAVMEQPPALLAHPDHPWLRASLDHLAHGPEDTRVVECKTAGWRNRSDWWDDSMLIPDAYAVQCLTYLAVTGLDACDVVADIAGDLVELTINRDPEWEQAAIPALEQWWFDHVLADEPPPIDYERDTLATLNRTWIPDYGEALHVPPDDPLLERIACAIQLREQAATLTADADRHRLHIRQEMGNSARITTGLTTVARVDTRGALRLTNPPAQEVTTP